MTEPRTSPLSLLVSATHEHGWLIESSHRTLDGTVLYVRCAACGTRRVDLTTGPATPPAALSRELCG